MKKIFKNIGFLNFLFFIPITLFFYYHPYFSIHEPLHYTKVVWTFSKVFDFIVVNLFYSAFFFAFYYTFIKTITKKDIYMLHDFTLPEIKETIEENYNNYEPPFSFYSTTARDKINPTTYKLLKFAIENNVLENSRKEQTEKILKIIDNYSPTKSS